MRFRHQDRSPENISLQMTPMIDVVFQLLVFFIMSFKIAAQEGDFNIKMPRAAPQTGVVQEPSLDMRLKLSANADGTLTQIRLNEQVFPDFRSLHQHVLTMLGSDAGPPAEGTAPELEIDCDYHLRYEYVVEAITAVSGYRRGDDIIKLIEKIRFTPPQPPS
jgi:biopolymer transport protein ExbD